MVFSDKGLENQMEEFAQPLEKQCMASEGGIWLQSLASRLCRANADFPVIGMTGGTRWGAWPLPVVRRELLFQRLARCVLRTVSALLEISRVWLNGS